LSFLQAELPQKRLEFLKEAVPHSTRIAVLWSPRGPGYESRQPLLHNLAVAARALALHLHVAELDRADELDSAFVCRVIVTVRQQFADDCSPISALCPLSSPSLLNQT
jgi:hypothetical protein